MDRQHIRQKKKRGKNASFLLQIELNNHVSQGCLTFTFDHFVSLSLIRRSLNRIKIS